LCYAKITPAPLHRGKFAGRHRNDAEAAGDRPEFVLSDFRHASTGSAAPAAQAR
jgi:hypothetical protein